MIALKALSRQSQTESLLLHFFIEVFDDISCHGNCENNAVVKICKKYS